MTIIIIIIITIIIIIITIIIIIIITIIIIIIIINVLSATLNNVSFLYSSLSPSIIGGGGDGIVKSYSFNKWFVSTVVTVVWLDDFVVRARARVCVCVCVCLLYTY